jgi:hypothetical protein
VEAVGVETVVVEQGRYTKKNEGGDEDVGEMEVKDSEVFTFVA